MIGQFDRFGAIEVDVNEPTRWFAKDDADIATVGKDVGSKSQVGPIATRRRLRPRAQRDAIPAPLAIDRDLRSNIEGAGFGQAIYSLVISRWGTCNLVARIGDVLKPLIDEPARKKRRHFSRSLSCMEWLARGFIFKLLKSFDKDVPFVLYQIKPSEMTFLTRKSDSDTWTSAPASWLNSAACYGTLAVAK